MDGVLIARDSHLGGLLDVFVVGTKSNLERDGTVGAMGSSHHPIGGNQRTATEVGIVNNNGDLPNSQKEYLCSVLLLYENVFFFTKEIRGG